MDTSTILEYVFYVLVLVVAGAAEYLKIAPPGTFLPLLTLIVGHYLGNVPTKKAIAKNTAALVDNTVATVESTQVKTNAGQ
jgi:hypothetical protein